MSWGGFKLEALSDISNLGTNLTGALNRAAGIDEDGEVVVVDGEEGEEVEEVDMSDEGDGAWGPPRCRVKMRMGKERWRRFQSLLLHP